VDEGFQRRLAEHAGLPYVPASELTAHVVPSLTPWAARSFGVVPIRQQADELVVATHDPATIDVTGLSALTGMRVAVAVSTQAAVSAELERLFPWPDPIEAPHVDTAPADEAERERYRRIARRAGLEFVELDSMGKTVDAVAHRLSPTACASLRALPLADEEGVLVVATDDPFAGLNLEVIAALAERPVRLVVAAPSDLSYAISRIFGGAPSTPVLPAAEETKGRLGQLLLSIGLIDEGELAEALGLQARTGDRLGHTLLHMRVLDESDLARTLAEQLALPQFDVARFEPDPGALRLVPEPVARRHRLVPLAIREHILYLAMADPLDGDALAELREHTELPVRIVVTSRTSIEELLQRIYQRRYVQLATLDLLNRSPEESAHRRLSGPQTVIGVILLVVTLLLLLYAPIKTLIGFNIFSTLFYTSFSIYKFTLIARALRHDLELPVTEDDVLSLETRELPVYTVLVPLYREAAVVAKLVNSIAKLDYPPTKLDVKLLVEEDDAETLAKLQELDLPPYFKLVVVPDSHPKTKPKACNYGLIQAEGKYVVIFDAEDRPDRDQLKKIVFAFGRAEARIVCIQCKLNYFNRTQNMLTRWFTAEYSHWFDLLMPGLDASDAPIPLGGTSNHFITEKLIELGAWDPYNVTEDADLGIRLHKAGYKTAIIDSTTFEEANSDLYNWIRQRSRWVKGYIQTWLVHMRHPIKLYRQVGWRSWWSLQFIIGGTFVSFLMNPVYWLLTTLWVMTRAHIIQQIFPSFVYYAGALGLFVGNFVFTYINVAGCVRRGHYDLVKFALLSPIYWALMSVGAWKGFVQLLYRPHYWEKTVHGLDVGVEPEYVHGHVR
jgi:cellulose synthase/poly-beta-1,6-N-acetylglucosamine synthase-like glycosyltransferase